MTKKMRTVIFFSLLSLCILSVPVYTKAAPVTLTTAGESQGTLSDDCSLASLKIAQSVLSPDFSPEQLTYTAVVPYEVDRIALTADTTSPLARMAIRGTSDLQVGSNEVTVTVTAQDGTTRVYRISVTRQEMVPETDEDGNVIAVETEVSDDDDDDGEAEEPEETEGLVEEGAENTEEAGELAGEEAETESEYPAEVTDNDLTDVPEETEESEQYIDEAYEEEETQSSGISGGTVVRLIVVYVVVFIIVVVALIVVIIALIVRHFRHKGDDDGYGYDDGYDDSDNSNGQGRSDDADELDDGYGSDIGSFEDMDLNVRDNAGDFGDTDAVQNFSEMNLTDLDLVDLDKETDTDNPGTGMGLVDLDEETDTDNPVAGMGLVDLDEETDADNPAAGMGLVELDDDTDIDDLDAELDADGDMQSGSKGNFGLNDKGSGPDTSDDDNIDFSFLNFD